MNNTIQTEISKQKRFYCYFENSDITSSIQQEYIHYTYLLIYQKQSILNC